jgi:Ca2+-binding RTX toxin-like protein
MINEDPTPAIGVTPFDAAAFGGLPFGLPGTTSSVSTTTSAAGSGFHINLIFDASTKSAPAGFVSQITQAASILDSLITNNITVNITVGWGEIGGQQIQPGLAEALGGPDTIYGLTYSSLKAYLTASATSADDLASVAHMPASDPLGHPATEDWWISSAQAKLFGLISPTDTALDGEIGFGTGWTSDWLGGALHELTHALGRIGGLSTTSSPLETSLDLFRYSSAGTFQFIGGQAAYFSLDGGATRLANFGVTSDYGDFKNGAAGLTPTDPFDEILSSDSWTALDSRVMDVLGFTLSGSTPATGKPDLTAGSFTFDGRTAAWQVANAGPGAAGASTAGVYLSADATITKSDTLVGSYATPALAAGSVDSESLVLNLPTNLAPGVYYLGIIANKTGAVSETNSTNNASNAIPILLGNNNANTLAGTAAVHVLLGEGGNDTLTAGPGNDIIDGGTGINRAIVSGAYATHTVSSTAGGYTVSSATANETLTNVQILQFSDRQMVLGSTGETLTTRATADTLVGGSGNDTLIATSGRYTLTGGDGADTFVFKSLAASKPGAPSTITDFTPGQDHLNLSAIDANTAAAGDQAFHLGATAKHVGDIVVTYDAVHNRTDVSLYVNADATADAVIWLSGHVALSASDFIF